jgi:hypothetical protein
MHPPDPTTRCHGSRADSDDEWRIHTTPRAARGLPAAAATDPYVITLPRGMDRTTAITRSVKGVLPMVPGSALGQEAGAAPPAPSGS